MTDTRYISVADTAKLIRTELKTTFPGIKLSVTSKSYAGGASIRVKWMDGPTEEEVTKITNKFEGASFDGMQDLKTYNDNELNGEPVHFGSDYVHTDRLYSLDFLTKAAAWYCKKWGYAMATFTVSESGSAYLEHDYYIEKRQGHFATLFWREYREINAKDIDTLGQEEQVLVSEQVEINNQPYTVVARNADELKQESLRMVEERTVSLPALDTFAASMQAAREEMQSDPYWNGPEAKKDFYSDNEVQTLFDDAVLRAIALGRPFERQEIFQKYWDMGVEIGPQDDRRFVLLQEATGLTPRVWGVRPDPTGLRVSVDAYLEKVVIQCNLIRFFEAVREYIILHLLGPNDMFVKGTCGHRYITKYVNRADLLAKRGNPCPECQSQKQESLTWNYKGQPLDVTVCGTCGHPYSRTRPDAAEAIFVVCPFQGQHEQESLQAAQEVQPDCAWCGTPVTGGIEKDGKRYCDSDCWAWYAALQTAGLRPQTQNALDCGILPTNTQPGAGLDTREPY